MIIRLSTETTIDKIAAGKYYSIMQGVNGTLFSTGYTDGAYLGLGEGVEAISPTAINTKGKELVQVNTGYMHAQLLTRDGLVFGDFTPSFNLLTGDKRDIFCFEMILARNQSALSFTIYLFIPLEEAHDLDVAVCTRHPKREIVVSRRIHSLVL